MKATNNIKRYSIEIMECDNRMYGEFYTARFLVDNITGERYELCSNIGGQEFDRPMIDVEVIINGRRFFGHTENELITKIMAGESARPAIFVPVWMRQ